MAQKEQVRWLKFAGLTIKLLKLYQKPQLLVSLLYFKKSNLNIEGANTLDYI